MPPVMQALGPGRIDVKDDLFKKLLSLLDFESGKRYDILDFGCGRGDLLGLISDTVAPESTLVGIDAMENPINHARELYPNIDFRHEKFIDSFSFPDACFDIVVSVDALECIPNKSAFLAEVARILRPTGKVLFAHWDWDTQVYNSEHKESIRKFVAAFSDWQQGWMDAGDGQMGRRLWGLFEGSGMFIGSMESFTMMETRYEAGQYGYDRLQDLAGLVKTGTIDGTEYYIVREEMKALTEGKNYFYSVNSYIYFGKKT
jgi:SAM-dependent methyltransferase